MKFTTKLKIIVFSFVVVFAVYQAWNFCRWLIEVLRGGMP
jgi:hypothetical protein